MLRPLFDTVGRKKMISVTHFLSGVLLAVSGWLFQHDDLTAYSHGKSLEDVTEPLTARAAEPIVEAEAATSPV